MYRRILTAISLIAASLLAQAPQQSGDYTLDGMVVNGATGEPLSHALVRLRGGGTQQEAMTGPDGRFSFDHLQAGGILASAQKPGFYTLQEIEPGSTVSVMQAGKDSGIKLNLYPSGTISGHVTTESDDPIEGISVKTFRRSIFDGSARWEQRNSSTTDDTGEYRITNVVPGDYRIATDTLPVRRLSPNVRSFGENFNLVYPGLYFPGLPDASGATVVRVAPGQNVEASFSEATARAYSASGAVSGGRPQPLFMTVADQDGAPINVRIERRAGRFRCLDLLSGDYTFSAMAPGTSNEMLYGSVSVAVNNSDVNGIFVELYHGAKIPVRFDYGGGGFNSGNSLGLADASGAPPIQLKLISEGPLATGNPAVYYPSTMGAGIQAFENVRPGKYRVEYQPTGAWYARGIRSGQSDLIKDGLTITPGAQPEAIQVDLEKGNTTLTGAVKGDNGPLPVSILIMAASNSGMAPRVYSGVHFSLSGLPPGVYRVYALTSITGLEYRNPEVMQKYADQSVTVNLSENETKQIDLPLISGSQL